jgi:orotate phosphoribosyltransferase
MTNNLQPHQQQFIELAIAQQALCFGEFTLKSGRVSPYFFNAGKFYSGQALTQLGHCYAVTINDAAVDFDVLLGPAYKGIPLATATACALYSDFARDVPYAYNRKEAKDHGEGGVLVGAPLQGRVLVIDDVITAGTAAREVFALIQQAGATIAGVVVGLDRQECGQHEQSAIQEIAAHFAIPVIAIVSLKDIITYLTTQDDYADVVKAIIAYRRQYGV